jgi:cyclic pyranopterin phosphate synthase
MVDVSAKSTTLREACASGAVYMKKQTLKLIREGKVPKGDVLAAARLAGIMAAKKTPELIPLCHPLNITSVEVDLKPQPTKGRLFITTKVLCNGQTGVEMEALAAVAAAALTVYDMCKAADREMTISDISLLEKKGGRSGHYKKK